MPATSRFLSAAGGGVIGAALCVGALAIGGVFDDSPSQVVTAAAPAGSAPVVRATPAAAGSLAALYEQTSPSVVEIRARDGGKGRPRVPVPRSPGRQSPSPVPPLPFPDPRGRDGVATGSGFVVDADGTIVTNAHVVGDSKDVTVRFDEDDEPIKAAVLGTDPSTDIAVLKIDPEAAGGRIQPLVLAKAGDANVGDTALAIGNPFGLERTATAGIISATGRQIEAPNGFPIAGAIQTDAPINPGNSGGPLLDGKGRVLGVNSQILTGGAQGNVGIGFAVPSTTLADVLPELKAGRRISRPFLGVSTAERPSGAGALVAEVVRGGPGDDAGLRARDVVVQIGKTEIKRPEDVAAAIEGRKPGDRIELTVTRGGARRTLDARLGTRPSSVR
ncbi:MAG: trypsin-like peptidase domain-containing protein [Actinomycetota bacterium]|nr:trypsin-like peptidase domain-containing protein [Actinomycetota bacterium]